MKRIALVIISFLMLAPLIRAQQPEGASVENVKMEREGGQMTVDMDFILSGMKISHNRAVLLTPSIVNGNDTLLLPSVGVYGRTRYYHYLRNGGMISGEDEISRRASRKLDSISYKAAVPYMDWMDNSQISLHREDYGCCRTLLSHYPDSLYGLYREKKPYFPELQYLRPVATGEKHYSISGSAFIDFPVDQTVIYHDYRRNASELAKIRATIDSVRNDSDVTVTSIWLKGYASPESPYKHNEELAKGRTAAVVKYISNLYDFRDGIIETEYEPEDWEGLRRFVENYSMTNKEQILALIDSDYEPDYKESLLRSRYPEEYRFLLAECYPALRHTDYRVEYNVRVFSDIEEIRRMMHTRPQKLSLDEFYRVAQVCEPGSEEFNEVFEIAVRMYPEDETANLNAANTAMQSGNLAKAERYLAKSGDSPDAVYARGVLEFLAGNYDAAGKHLAKAMAEGISRAGDVLAEMETLGNIK